jgi:hypothetical protein
MDDTSLPFSSQLFELQAAANALTARIVGHVRGQWPGLRTTNHPMLQKLCEERRQLWNTIEELERKVPVDASHRGSPMRSRYNRRA